MNDNKLLKYTEYFFTGIFLAGIFVFFAFFYNNHLHFEEESRIFLFSRDYFFSRLKFPGGFSGWTGGFLTQFYYLSLIGPVIITCLLFGVQRTTFKILSSINGNRWFFPLSFLPALNAALILCDEFYPLSGVIGFLLALLAGWLYISIQNRTKRFLSGILLILIIYWLAGGSYLSLISVILGYEILSALKRSGKKKEARQDFRMIKVWQMAVLFIISAGMPLLVRQYLIMQPAGLSFFSEFYYDIRSVLPKAIPVLFALPAFLMILVFFLPSGERNYKAALFVQIILFIPAIIFGLRLWANFSAESIMKYDYLVRMGRWNDVIKYAEKNPPRNNLSLAMLNLSLAKTGTMGDRMFSYEQDGADGLFLPFAKEYIAPMMGSEIFYNLGLVNASQEYSFESMESTPSFVKPVRSIKRLAETNLINRHYEVAGKYLKILEKTLFYRKWALRTEKYLYNEDMINKDPDWGGKRKMIITKDFFFKIENIEGILNLLMDRDPGNNIAYQYLMGLYLLNKDLKDFMIRVPVMNDLGYTRIPTSYQEAIMYVVGLTTDNPMANTPYRISSDTKLRMKAYADIYTTNKNPQKLLSKRFSDTYWYYFHFKKIKIKDQK